MSASKTATSDIQILGKQYQIACSLEEEQELQKAARYLNEQMKQIRDTGKVIGLERIAIMAALNISHQLLSEKEVDSVQNQQQQIQRLNSKLTDTLNRLKQLEI